MKTGPRLQTKPKNHETLVTAIQTANQESLSNFFEVIIKGFM
jgi:hypothetical protein